MSSLAPEQHDSAGPRGGLAGRPAAPRAGLPGRPAGPRGGLPGRPAGPRGGLPGLTSERLDGPAFVAFPPAVADLDLTPGRQIRASVKAAETHAHPA
ncbi:hypothetical protein [Nonomuraea sp. NPDC049625]|uniref:hypothetical protein n=1 Tax=Nonomuraea sp. NPDC049625 TaxID=3155775 RepID=UPI00341FB992